MAFGPYVITRRIARGGMAEIYRARTRTAEVDGGRWVALKLMRSSLGHEELRLKLFEREARIASRLSHPNVVPVFEYGQEMGRPYLAMEYVLGRDLSHLLKSEKKGRELIDYRLGLYVGLLAAKGLGHAHRLVDEASGQPLGIVHRDISPGNVMIGYGGEVKVLDFGVARMNETQGFHTQTGTLRGKFAYMSPEQTLGEDLDARSDVFSFGTVLYELLTGINCFRAQNPIATLERVQGLRPVPPSRVNRDIPKAVDKILARCLAKDRRRRFKDGVALAEAIEAFLASDGYVGHQALVDHMEAEFSWEKHEETSELAREEEEVALFDVVDFALLSNAAELDAKNLAVSTEEEASQSEVANVVRSAAEAQSGVFEGEGDVPSGEAVAPDEDLYVEDDATVAQPRPLAFEDQIHEAGAKVEVASLLAPEADARTDMPEPSVERTAVTSPPPRAPSLSMTASDIAEEDASVGPRAATPIPEAALAPPPPARPRLATWGGALLLVLLAGLGAYVFGRGAGDEDGPSVPPTKIAPVRITLEPSRRAPQAEPVAARPSVEPEDVDASGADEELELPTGDAEPEAEPEVAIAPEAGPEVQPEAEAEPLRAAPRAVPAAARQPAREPAPSKPRPDRIRRPRSAPSKAKTARAKPRRSRKRRRALVGYLNVGAKPWAEIEIDGKPWPYQTPQAGIELRPGKHNVVLHNPDTGMTKKSVVYIKAGAYRTVMMDMRKNR